MKKRSILSLLLALLMLTASACGGGDANAPQTGGNDTPSDAAAQPSGDDQTSSDNTEIEYTIQWYCDANSIETGLAASVQKRFHEKYPQWDVNIVETDAAPDQKMTMIAGGEVIDCMYNDSFTAVKGGASGTFLELNQFFEQDGEDFVDLYGQLAYDTASRNGKIYGIPHYYNTFKVFYNKTMTDAKGITIPESWTWEEFKETARQLEDRDNNIWGAIYPVTWSDTVLAPAQVMGWSPVKADSDGNVTPNFDDERLEIVMKAVKDLADVDAISPSMAQMKAESLSRRVEFANQRCAMFLDGPYTFTWLKGYMFNDPGDGNLGFEVGVTEIPYFEGYDGDKCSFLTVPGLTAIPKTSGNPYAAYKFVRFLEEDYETAVMNSAYMSCYTKWEEEGHSYDQLNIDVFNNFIDIFGEKHTDIYSEDMIRALCTIPKEAHTVYYNSDTRLIPAEYQMAEIYNDQFSLYFTGEMEFDEWAEATNKVGMERLTATGTDKV